MTKTTVIISATSASRLKKKAKLIHRQTGRPHHEALEEVAVGAGFNNWHQIAEGAKHTSELEKRFRRGLYLLMDVKEAADAGDDFETCDEPLIFREQEIFKWFCAVHEDNRDTSLEEFREHMEINYVCLRYTGKHVPRRSSVVSDTREILYWSADLIWLRGECIDPMVEGVDEDDMDGPAEPMPTIDESELRSAFGDGSGLVLNSPDTMERYETFSGPRKAWNWCLHCERVYPQGSYRKVRNLQMCPYAGCDGDAVMDLWPWTTVFKANPGYPDVPKLGIVYALYGPNHVR